MDSRFCRAVGTNVHDRFDQPIVFQGMGIGGWLLIEGYMIQSRGSIDRPRRFYDHLIKTVGEEEAQSFIKQWQTYFFTEEDVAYLAKHGFNLIRIALDYAVFFEPSDHEATLKLNPEAWERLDHIVDACERHGVYVMLDLHAAPGGQTGANIDNSKDDHPELFKHRLYQDQTVFVWETFAQHYRHSKTIAAYDLLNEPLPKWFNQYNEALMPLYERLIKAIRAIDKDHMITLEGLHWSTDFSCFKTLSDDNVLLQFHKYWCAPEEAQMTEYLKAREHHQRPIIMGEGGENNLLWYAAAFKMYLQHDIGTVFWSYKKMATHNSLKSFDKPQKWDAFLEGKLDKEERLQTLNELLHAIRYDQTQSLPEVIHALQNRQSFTLWAHSYDYLGLNRSFYRETPHSSSIRKADGMRIVNAKGEVTEPNFWHQKGEEVAINDRLYLVLEKEEWVNYTFHIAPPTHRVLIELLNVKGDIEVSINGVPMTLHEHSIFASNLNLTNTLTIKANQTTWLERLRFTALDVKGNFVTD